MDTPIQRKRKRLKGLRDERLSWLEHWRELADFALPRQYRFLTTWTNKGWKRNNNIINNTATRALRTMSAGMMSGITSPARPWFRLSMKDENLGEYGPVRAWLDAVQNRLTETFASSNIYNCLHQIYRQLGLFGTAVLHIEEDSVDLLRGYVFPIGQYCLANSARLQVDTIYREFRMTATQLQQSFGDDALSQRVREMLRNNGDQWVDVVHAIEPNAEREYKKAGGKNMPWASCWYEAIADDAEKKYLRESGFEEFPAMAPRWDVVGEDVYGESPGMDALGDVKSLQLVERRKAQVFDKIVNPPMRAPTSLMNQRASLLPGDITYVDANSAGQTFAPAVELNANAAEVAEATSKEVMQRIDATFYADLWMSMLGNDNADMTAREVVERHEEKMIQLGPVMERVEGELLEPLIERAFAIHLRNNKLPPMPPQVMKAMSGQQIQIEYISIMAQAQKMLGSSAVERLVTFATNIAAAKPDVLDKIDFDKTIEKYSDMLGVDSSLIVPQDQVEQIRAQRAQAAAQQAQAQNMLAAAKGAQALSGTDMESDNGLTRIINGLSPVAAAAAGGGAQ